MKLLIIKSNEELIWNSCKSISSNLKEAYSILEHKSNGKIEIEWFGLSLNYFYYERNEAVNEVDELAKKIKKIKPDFIVFVDHLPLPPVVLQRLELFIDLIKLPPIIMHIYGDFTYFAYSWNSFLEKATGLKLVFIAASDSQQKLLTYFLSQKVNIRKCHFPVRNECKFDNKLRKEFRDNLGVKDEDYLILYAGRINLQKNVDVLIKEFDRLVRSKPDKNFHLLVAGGYDDSGALVFGIKTKEGYIHSKMRSLVSSLDNKTQSKIKFLGALNKNDLRKALSGSDCFVSLSLFHDEDFGMSPAEALISGLPSILTDWGGYSSFKSPQDEWDCELLPVEIIDFGHSINMEKLHKNIIRNSSEEFDSQKRLKRGKKFFDTFSAEKASMILEEILNSKIDKFEDRHWKMVQFTKLVDFRAANKVNSFFLPFKESYYQEVYSNYISGKGNDNE